MKFTIFALLGALASTGASQLRTNVRKLDGANYRAELDGTANISFAKCIEVTVQTDDDEDVQAAVLAGTARPVKAYAAFYTSDSATDDEMMMTSLGDYVSAKITASAMKSQKACETCREFEDTCNPQQEEDEEAAEGEEAEEGQDGGEGRKLATAIDESFCYECQTQGCYAEEEDNGEVDYEEQLARFIEEAAGCMQVPNYQDANGNYAYIGMTCGSYGDAAEFAVFLDDECTIETNQVSASSVLASAGANDDGVSLSEIFTFASWYMQEAFTTKLSCEQVEYYDPNADNDENGNNNQNQNAYEMNEVCGQITDEAVYIADCVAQDEAEEEADAYADEEETWYDFDVQDGGDIDEVCAIVNEKMNSGGKFKYFYDEKKQGTSYKRGVTGSLKSNNSGMSGGLIFLIVALVLGFFFCICASASKKNSRVKDESAYLGDSLSVSSDAGSIGGMSKSGKTSYRYKQYFMLYMKRLKSKFARN